MNILLIIVAVVFLLNLYAGYKNGFLKTIFSLVAWIIALVICNIATPVVTDFLMEQTTIASDVENVIEEKMDEMLAQAVEGSDIQNLQDVLPESVYEMIFHGGMAGNGLPTEGALDLTPLVRSVIQILAFVIVIIAVRILLWVAELVLGVASHLPLIGTMDKALGLAGGFAKGIFLCWVLLAVVTILAFSGINTEWAVYIYQSQMLSWLQENNIILNLIL